MEERKGNGYGGSLGSVLGCLDAVSGSRRLGDSIQGRGCIAAPSEGISATHSASVSQVALSAKARVPTTLGKCGQFGSCPQQLPRLIWNFSACG